MTNSHPCLPPTHAKLHEENLYRIRKAVAIQDQTHRARVLEIGSHSPKPIRVYKGLIDWLKSL